MKRFNSLFQEIKVLQDGYRERNCREAYGFNIFTVLLKSGDEVNLHTKFIYELLNPLGTHGQGRLFLNLFLQELSLDIFQERLEAFREKENIDILLQSEDTSIIIENVGDFLGGGGQMGLKIPLLLLKIKYIPKTTLRN